MHTIVYHARQHTPCDSVFRPIFSKTCIEGGGINNQNDGFGEISLRGFHRHRRVARRFSLSPLPENTQFRTSSEGVYYLITPGDMCVLLQLVGYACWLITRVIFGVLYYHRGLYVVCYFVTRVICGVTCVMWCCIITRVICGVLYYHT